MDMIVLGPSGADRCPPRPVILASPPGGQQGADPGHRPQRPTDHDANRASTSRSSSPINCCSAILPSP